MKAVCVDDEQMSLDEIRSVIGTIKEITDSEYFLSPISALEWLKTNSADVAFLDIKMRQMDGLSLARTIKEIQPRCSVVFVTGYDQYAVEAFRLHPSGYLMKPFSADDIRQELEHIRSPLPHKATHRIRVQCFGNFEVFADGAPLHFERSRTKEVLAFLVDRRGASSNTNEICTALWEDDEDIAAQHKQFRKYMSDLTRTLKSVDAENILSKGHNSFAIVTENVDCELYDYISGRADAINSYHGEYMAQYSWAEMTNGNLTIKK